MYDINLLLASKIGGGATEPYVEETYDNDGYILTASFHGVKGIRVKSYCVSSSGQKLHTVVFDESLEHIRQYAFQQTSIRELIFPASLKEIEVGAFEGDAQLTTVTFKGTPTTLNGNVFRTCSRLTTINVPWAEDAVDGAPWSATNATINYNYTEG